METTTKKVTRATLKTFINKNINNLYIKNKSNFDGMVDCVMDNQGAQYRKAVPATAESTYNLGIAGAWFVGQSRDYFEVIETAEYFGYNVSNCCGSFDLVIKKTN